MRAPTLASFLLLVASGCGGADEYVPVAVDATASVDARATDAGPDAPTGKLCGGFIGAGCEADEYCDFPDNDCGGADAQGTCTPRPTDCPDVLVFVPNCACDGVVYGSECDAYAAGADRDALGSCPVAAGAFVCGYTQCNLFTQYCQRQISDVVGEPDGYTCMPVPSCPSQFPTCACLADEACGESCSGMGATGLTLTCPGG